MSNHRRCLVACLFAALTVSPVSDAPAQGNACRQVLATTTVSGNSYAAVAAQPFEGRVFVYVPALAPAGGGFRPFQLWVVEGLYGPPFVRSSGALSPSDFEKLRASRNVRATALAVSRGTEAEATTVRVGKTSYRLQVTGVNAAGGGSVHVQACLTS